VRTLRRNRRKVYYSQRSIDRVPILDEFGNETGEYEYDWSDPAELWLNMSPDRGSVESRIFGDSEEYDRQIVVETTPLREGDRLWVRQQDVTKPHDYVVSKYAEGLNSVTLAIKRVDVT
jgi:hypothetical protein